MTERSMPEDALFDEKGNALFTVIDIRYDPALSSYDHTEINTKLLPILEQLEKDAADASYPLVRSIAVGPVHRSEDVLDPPTWVVRCTVEIIVPLR
jgi:hypothetical protein